MDLLLKFLLPASFHQPQLHLGLTLLFYYSVDFLTLTQMQQSARAERFLKKHYN